MECAFDCDWLRFERFDETQIIEGVDLRVNRIARDDALRRPLTVQFGKVGIGPGADAITIWGERALRDLEPSQRRRLLRFVKNETDIDRFRFDRFSKITKVSLGRICEKKCALQPGI